MYRYDAPLFFANAENFVARALKAVDEDPDPKPIRRWTSPPSMRSTVCARTWKRGENIFPTLPTAVEAYRNRANV